MRRLAPVIGLFLLAPLVAEFLLGNLSITMLPMLVILAPLYGGGALVIRETTRRLGRGWPTMLLFAAAYGVFEEGITTLSLFNPDYAHGHLMDSGFIPALGIAGPWTVSVITLHVVWSISTPIALVELFVPDRRTTPWLGRTGLIVAAVLLLFGGVGSLMGTEAAYPYTPTFEQMAGAVVVIVALVLAGLRAGRGPRAAAGRTAPSPWIVGGTALVAAAAYKELPNGWNPWLITGLVPAVGLAMVAAVVYWSAGSGWDDRHRLALVTAALAVYAITAFWQVPMMGASPAVELAGHIVLAIGAAALVVLAARRIRSAGAPVEAAVTGRP
ncbi:MAG TPA: hypothetical protein VGL93_32345 [Streptosporangiaceae bacterium]|jgi:hypothetical protein